MSDNQAEVIVVGAGPTGLLLAGDLAESGVERDRAREARRRPLEPLPRLRRPRPHPRDIRRPRPDGRPVRPRRQQARRALPVRQGRPGPQAPRQPLRLRAHDPAVPRGAGAARTRGARGRRFPIRLQGERHRPGRRPRHRPHRTGRLHRGLCRRHRRRALGRPRSRRHPLPRRGRPALDHARRREARRAAGREPVHRRGRRRLLLRRRLRRRLLADHRLEQRRPAARRRTGRPGRGPRGRRTRRRHRPRDARRALGLAVPLRRAPGPALPRGQRLPRRGRRPLPLARRRPGHEHRAPGRGQSVLEARRGDARRRPGTARFL